MVNPATQNRGLVYGKPHPCFHRGLPRAWRCGNAFVADEGCLLYVDSGSITLSVNFCMNLYAEGSLVLIHPGDLVAQKSMSSDASVRWVGFPEKCWTDAVHLTNVPQRLPVYVPQGNRHFLQIGRLADFYLRKMEICIELGLPQDSLDSIFRNGLLSLFLVLAERCSSESSVSQTLYGKFIELLVECAAKEHDVSFYAASLSVSQKHLTATLRALTGFSAKHCIDQYLAAMLRKALSDSGKELKRIAELYGFPTQSYFSQFFMRLTGMTPRDYRKRLAQEGSAPAG